MELPEFPITCNRARPFKAANATLYPAVAIEHKCS